MEVGTTMETGATSVQFRRNLAMTLAEKVDHITCREDLAEFVDALLHDLEENGSRWENSSLEDFLEALAAYIVDLDGYFRNIGESVPDQPSWKLVGGILLAASMYE